MPGALVISGDFMAKTKKDEVMVLLAEEKIGPYVIKPWSFGRFEKVLPALIPMVPALENLGATASNIETFLEEKGLAVIGVMLPAIKGLIAATLEIEEREVAEMPLGQATVIGLTIISQNIGQIKNYLPLIVKQIGAIRASSN